ncbi:hypothetical protein GCM10009525_06290 [Streptosporangium amethystogenes subsp. fukuiense]
MGSPDNPGNTAHPVIQLREKTLNARRKVKERNPRAVPGDAGGRPVPPFDDWRANPRRGQNRHWRLIAACELP